MQCIHVGTPLDRRVGLSRVSACRYLKRSARPPHGNFGEGSGHGHTPVGPLLRVHFHCLRLFARRGHAASLQRGGSISQTSPSRVEGLQSSGPHIWIRRTQNIALHMFTRCSSSSKSPRRTVRGPGVCRQIRLEDCSVAKCFCMVAFLSLKTSKALMRLNAHLLPDMALFQPPNVAANTMAAHR